jgi:plastocyanin
MRRALVAAALVAGAVGATAPAFAKAPVRHCRHRAHHRCVRTAKPKPRPKPKAKAPPPQSTALPTRSGVDEGEYYLTPTHTTVAAGTVELDPVNLGMDEHNLTIEDAQGNLVGLVTVEPGQTQTIDVQLAPGSYRLFCSLYNHAALGMNATLTVR